MSKRERIRMEDADGKLVAELDEETTRQVFALAKAKRITPHAAIRQLFKKGYDVMIAKRNGTN